MRLVLALMLSLAPCAWCQRSDPEARQRAEINSARTTRASAYIARESARIDSHATELRQSGRLPEQISHSVVEILLGQYGWHTEREPRTSYPDMRSANVRAENGGAFGAYTFSSAASEQAKRTWVIHGFMMPGSDLLWPTNANARFDKGVVGYTVALIKEAGCYADDGKTPCEPGVDNQHRAIQNAHVVDVFGLEEQSNPAYWRGPLKLDVKAPALMQQFLIMITPKDWVDMCRCMSGSR